MEERRTRTSADTKLAPSHVLRLHVEGNTYEEISERLGRHVKSIDNALQRIKRKLRPHAQTLTEEVFAGV